MHKQEAAVSNKSCIVRLATVDKYNTLAKVSEIGDKVRFNDKQKFQRNLVDNRASLPDRQATWCLYTRRELAHVLYVWHS